MSMAARSKSRLFFASATNKDRRGRVRLAGAATACGRLWRAAGPVRAQRGGRNRTRGSVARSLRVATLDGVHNPYRVPARRAVESAKARRPVDWERILRMTLTVLIWGVRTYIDLL
jgi:hypothetical protein